MRAAWIYQHATFERDQEIAEKMNRRIADREGRKHRQDEGDDGAAGVLARTG
jgi:hypothetical protein